MPTYSGFGPLRLFTSFNRHIVINTARVLLMYLSIHLFVILLLLYLPALFLFTVWICGCVLVAYGSHLCANKELGFFEKSRKIWRYYINFDVSVEQVVGKTLFLCRFLFNKLHMLMKTIQVMCADQSTNHDDYPFPAFCHLLPLWIYSNHSMWLMWKVLNDLTSIDSTNVYSIAIRK